MPLLFADKIVHILLFGGLALATRPYIGGPAMRAFLLSGVFYGTFSECVQGLLIPGREFALGDIAADCCGAGIALWLRAAALAVALQKS